MKEKLEPSGNGLFRLRRDIAAAVEATVPPACRAPVFFVPAVEVSTVYHKAGRGRRVHHLIVAPSFVAMDRLAAALVRYGRLEPDGRPTLRFDSRDLLDAVLSCDPAAYLIPAHIWTPWYAALGARGGFDSLAECYGDLLPHVFAIETGLSSDPAMNRRVSALDRFRLVSSSDAHSPDKLGREATRFAGSPGYAEIRTALATGEGLHGTVEFFPEEGKYHHDGHRTCGVILSPAVARAGGGLCPVCGRPLTVGVAHRVEALADRDAAEGARRAAAEAETVGLVPLVEILAEIAGVGASAKSVLRRREDLLAAFGPEFRILLETPPADLGRRDSRLAEAVVRLRRGDVIRKPGADGAYGCIRLFASGELA